MGAQDFPPMEFQTRVARAQAGMQGIGVDALFFTSEAEMRYFTGFRTLFWQSPTRPWFLILPAYGEPIAIIPEIGAALMRETWISDIRIWSSPHENDDGISLLVKALESFRAVGVLKGRESALRMPLNDFEQLQTQSVACRFVDATPLMQSLRMVKSEAEIALTARICDIASGAFEAAATLFQVGQPLDDVFRVFRIELLQRGADDVPYLVGGAGQGGYADVISPPDGTPLQAGDVLMLDTGATLQGYYCDFDRNWAFGHADDAARRAYETLYRATDAALAMARPGITCAELWATMQKVIDQPGNDVGRFGHGLGMQLTEVPSLIAWDQTTLAENMVITLEPSMAVSPGRIMVHEENIVIRKDGAELLSRRAPPELPVLT